jgi:hypothetical protein
MKGALSQRGSFFLLASSQKKEPPLCHPYFYNRKKAAYTWGHREERQKAKDLILEM